LKCLKSRPGAGEADGGAQIEKANATSRVTAPAA